MREDARPNFYQQLTVPGVAMVDGASRENASVGATKDLLPSTVVGQIMVTIRNVQGHVVAVYNTKNAGAITQDLKMGEDTVKALAEFTECVMYR